MCTLLTEKRKEISYFVWLQLFSLLWHQNRDRGVYICIYIIVVLYWGLKYRYHGKSSYRWTLPDLIRLLLHGFRQMVDGSNKTQPDRQPIRATDSDLWPIRATKHELQPIRATKHVLSEQWNVWHVTCRIWTSDAPLSNHHIEHGLC